MKKKKICSLFLTLMLVLVSFLAVLPARPVLAANYTLTVVSAAGGTVTSPGESVFTYAAGTVVTLVAQPDSGYSFAGWVGDVSTIVDASAASTTITMNGNYTISASFSGTTLIITATAGANGTISPSGDISVSYGGSQTFIITPNAGYRIVDVVVDGASVGALSSYTFTNVTVSHTITTSFAINTFTVTATAGANGLISPSGAIAVNYGTSQTFTITPNTGYHITGITVDGASVGVVNSYTFNNVTVAHTITANFAINTYTITATSGTNGSVSPSGAVTVNYGGNQVYTITPNTGYHVTAVLVDGASLGALTSYTFSSVTGDHTIAVSFAINTYTIIAINGDHGLISPPGTVTINYGGSQTYTITPTTGYHVVNVLVDGAFVGAVTSYAFSNVTTDHTISVSFAINTYTITPTAGNHGSISPFTAVTINYADSQTFAITADSAYRITDVRVDGISKGAVATYTFTNVTADHTIDAAFAIGWPFYAAFGIGAVLVFLLGFWIGKKTGGSAY
ncbi:MAG: hypothetical protein ABR958_09955 [Dehalococcoidales bacterium]